MIKCNRVIAYITWIDFSVHNYVHAYVAVTQCHKFVTDTHNYPFLQYVIVILMHQPELENYFLTPATAK